MSRTIKSIADLYIIDPTRPKKSGKVEFPKQFEYYGAVNGAVQCRHMAPMDEWYCTRPKGHEGVHEAVHGNNNQSWALPWLDGKYITVKDLPKCGVEVDGKPCTKLFSHDGEHQAKVSWGPYKKQYSAAPGALYESQHKPVYKIAPTYDQCYKPAPLQGYVCTRIKGHDGDHEAHFSTNSPCGPPWSDDVEYELVGEIE